MYEVGHKWNVLSTFCLLFLMGLSGIGCGESQERGEAEQVGAEGETAKEPTSSFPFEFPMVSTSGEVGEYVLTPSRKSFDEAVEEGADKATFTFYTATMEEVGEEESNVRSLSGKDYTISNNLIIPLGKGATAKKGDILLTWWQSGSGMKRAIVVDDANPAEPVVRYLDIKLDNPAKRDGVPLGELEEQLKPNSFRVMKSAWEPGTIVVVRDGSRQKHLQIIRVEGESILVRGFAGKMKVVKRSDATPVPIIPDVAEGDNVWIEHIGSFREGVVKRIDKRNGRVFVEFEFAGKTKEKGSPFGDVIKEL